MDLKQLQDLVLIFLELGVGTEVAQVVAITLLFIVIWASLVAAVLPLILRPETTAGSSFNFLRIKGKTAATREAQITINNKVIL
jgi:hypothetical protein